MLYINWISNRSLNKKEISINYYIDSNSDFIKEYLKFIENVRNIKFEGKNIASYTSFEKKFNLFDVGIFEEKSIYKSSNIFEVLKILSLKNILKKKKKIKIKNLNVKSYKAIKLLRKKYDIEIEDENSIQIRYIFYNILRIAKIIYKQINVFGHIVKKLLFKFILSDSCNIKNYNNIIISNTYRTINKSLDNKNDIKYFFFGNLNSKIEKQRNLFLAHHYKQKRSIFYYNKIFRKISDNNIHFTFFESLIDFNNLLKSANIFISFFFKRKNLNKIKNKIIF